MPSDWKMNQVFIECGSCPRTCEDIQNNTPEKFYGTSCSRGCFCRKGYFINEAGECIPEKLCQSRGNSTPDIFGKKFE